MARPSNSAPPKGQPVPRLRWWMRIDPAAARSTTSPAVEGSQAFQGFTFRQAVTTARSLVAVKRMSGLRSAT